MASSPNTRLLAEQRAWGGLRDAIRFAQNNASKPQHDKYAQGLKDDYLSRDVPRPMTMHVALYLFRNADERGIPEWVRDLVAERVVQVFLPTRTSDVPAYAHAHAECERAEAEVEKLEADYQESPSGATLLLMETAKKKVAYCGKIEIEAARRSLYRSPMGAA